MLILGSCLALNLSYSGCCVTSMSPLCNSNGCYCDQSCHNWKDCCSDIADIGCHHPDSSFSPTTLLTSTNTLGKKKIFLTTCHLKATMFSFIIII